MDTGFITLHRKILDNPIWKNSQIVHLFLTLLLWANHEEKKTLFNGKVETIKRGQLITGRLALAKKTGISPNTIKDHLSILQNLGIITKKSTNKFTLITIVKYSEYQDKKEKDTSKNTNQTPTRHQPDTTNNNVNNDNNVNNKPAPRGGGEQQLFELFYKTVNPTISFNNKTEWKAARELVKHFGLDKTLKTAEYAISVHGKPYAPTISTPYQLKVKLPDLMAYYKKESNKQTNAIQL